jgi:prepilin-type N-terminal cleavage/methylation domain-containing protein
MTARGVTLLELLAGLALFGALTAVAVPHVAVLRARWRLGAAARQVVMDLKVARARAMADVANRRVRFTVPGSAYQHQRQDNGRYLDDGGPMALPEGISIGACSAVGSAVGFRPRGPATTFGTITLRNERGEQRRIVVDIVGRMRIE